MPLRGKIGVIHEILRNDDELSIEWRIEDFLTLSSAGVDFYESSEFSFDDKEWFLSVWPSGMTWASFDWVDLYLFRKGASGPPQTLDVSVAIKGSDPSAAEGKGEKIFEFCSRDDGCGWSNFCLRSTLQNRQSSLMPDGVLTITCDVKRCVPGPKPSNTDDVTSCQEAAIQLEALAGRSQSSDEQDVASNQEAPIQTAAVSEGSQSTENQAPPLNRHADVIRCMRALLEEGRRSDFTLRLGGRRWALHKFILESRCPHFADKLLGEWAGSAEGVVTDDDDVIKEDALDSVLHFIYTGEVEDVYVEDLCDLYVAADRCKLDGLKPLCVDSMKENMCAEIVCGALAIAKTHGEEELNRVALDYFVQDAEKIFETEEWGELQRKHPGILAELLEESAKRGI